MVVSETSGNTIRQPVGQGADRDSAHRSDDDRDGDEQGLLERAEVQEVLELRLPAGSSRGEHIRLTPGLSSATEVGPGR
jgi:hypothetical protein